MDPGIRSQGSVLVVCEGEPRPKSWGVGSFGGAVLKDVSPLLIVLFNPSIDTIPSRLLQSAA
jgi:hypothetical protein